MGKGSKGKARILNETVSARDAGRECCTDEEEKTLYLNEAGQTPTLILENTKARHVGARTDCLPEITSFARTSLCKANRRKRRWMAPFMAREVVTKTDPSIAFCVSDSLSLTLLRPFSGFEGPFNSIFPRKMALVFSQSSLDLNNVLKVIKNKCQWQIQDIQDERKGQALVSIHGKICTHQSGGVGLPPPGGLVTVLLMPGLPAPPHSSEVPDLKG